MKTFLKVSAQRLLSQSKYLNNNYKPVGYILSAEKDKEDVKLNQREKMINKRMDKIEIQIAQRIK